MKFKHLVLPILLVPTLVGCGQAHSHTYSNEWSHDQNKHWHAATCEHKDLVKDEEEHVFDRNMKCTVCNYSVFDDKSYFFPKEPEIMTAETYLSTVIKLPQEILALLTELPTFKKYTIYYMSTDLLENEVMMSASLTVPYFSGTPTISGIVVDSHPTLTDLKEAPTQRWDKYLINALPGYAVFQCDLMGFGSQSDKISDYHCRHLADRNTVDGIFALYDLLEDIYHVDGDTLPMYNIGYSQGGYTSMALLRYMETEASLYEKSRIHFTKTISGSGAYDINLMFNTCFKIDDYKYCQYLIKGILTTHEYHPSAYQNIQVEDYLTEYGKEFLDPLIRKDNNLLELVMAETDKTGKPLYQGPKSVFVQEYLNEDSELHKAVDRACESENLLDEEWYPEGDLDLYYTPWDTMVTPKCTEKAIDLFGELDNVTVHESLTELDHQDYGTAFYISTLLEFLLA